MALDFKEDDDSSKIDFQGLDFQEDSSSNGKSLLDYAKGAGEAALHVGSSLASFPVGIVGMGAHAVNELTQGKVPSRQELDETFGTVAGNATYEPKTQFGQTLVKPFDQLMESAPALAGHADVLHGMPSVRDVIPSLDKTNTLPDAIADIQKKQSDAEALQKKSPQPQPGQGDMFSEPEVQGKTPNPYEANPGNWTADENGIPIRQDLSLDAQQMETPTQPDMFNKPMQPDIPNPEQPNMRSPAIDEALQQQQTQEIMEHLKNLDDQMSGIEDYNARYANEDLIDKLREYEANRGNNPFYVDNQGQVFRGDPNELGARAGLEAQTHAFDTEMTHLRGIDTPEGEPLRPLQDPNLNADRATARQNLMDNFKEGPISSKGKMGRQRGAIDVGSIKDAADALRRGAIGVKDYLQSWKGAFDPQAFDRLMNPPKGSRVELMAPRDFHKVAALRGKEGLSDAPRLRGKIEDALNSQKGLFETPELWTKTQGGISKVVEHEGRNRMDVFRQMGIDKVPTLVHDTSVDGSKPSHLQAQWTDNTFARVPTGEQAGRVRPPSPGNKQTGGIFLNNFMRKVDIAKDAEKFANGQKQRYGDIPTDRPVEDTIKDARGESDGKGLNYFESGGILAAMKRGSTAIRDAVRTVQNAYKRGDWQVNQFVHPVERSVKGLSSSDRSLLWNGVLKQELLKGQKYDPEVLKTLPPKVQAAYAHFRRMFDDTLNIQNQQRRAEGKPEITPLEAYVSSRWSGDFRRPIYQAVLDKQGNPVFDDEGMPQKKLVWYLAGENKLDLNAQTKALLQKFPDLMHDPKLDHQVKYYTKKTDMQSAYTRALDVLGRDDPAVQKLKEAAEAEMTNQSANFLNQNKHFEPKSGIRGFVGDRPGKDGSAKEALAGLQQQIDYGKNAYRWAEIQKAGDNIKQIVNDPILAEKQPNNVKFIREYYKNALGFGEAPAIAHMTDSLRNLGFSPSSINGIIANSKSFFILQKLALNAKTSMMHMLQSANVFPHLTDVWTKEGGHDPVTSYAVGFPAGVALATKHYSDFLNGKGPGDVLSNADRGFFQRAFKYSEDNMVATHTIYNEAPIDKQFGAISTVGRTLGHALGAPETLSRSVAFMSLVHALRGSEKYKGNETALFQRAEELTQAAMGDYRSPERALVFHKLGAVGNALNTLQTYPMNQINQWNYFARQAVKGNIAPLATLIAVQYTMAGIMGLPGADDMDKLYQFTKNHIISDKSFIAAQKSEFWSDPKLWALHHWGTDTVDGWVSAKSGLGISSSLRSAMPSEMVRAPGAPFVDIGKQMVNAGKAAVSPMLEGNAPFSNKTMNAQVAMGSLPSGAPQGLFEESKGMQGTTWMSRPNPQTGQQEHVYQRPGDLMSHTGVSTRTPEEETLRRFGLRSERETLERDIGYRQSETDQATKDRANGVVEKFVDAVTRGDKQAAADYYKAHVELTGQPITDSTITQRMEREYTTGAERASTGAKTVNQILEAAKTQGLINQIRKEQGNGSK